MAFMKKSVALTTTPRFGAADSKPVREPQARQTSLVDATCPKCGCSLDEEKDGRSPICAGCR